MMKKLKKGFSLAEVLIVLAIVSVIATMGFSIAKRGIERAYEGFIYTGYDSLNDAIAYVNAKDITASEEVSFFTEMAKVLNAEYQEVEGHHILKNKNGVEYRFDGPNITGDYTLDYTVYLTVPAPSHHIGNNVYNKSTYLLKYFFTSEDLNIILPVDGNVYAPINDNDFAINNDLNYIARDLPNRKDLLPYYIDDGIAGHVIAGTYYPKTYYSLREAYCISNLHFKDSDGNSQKLPAEVLSWDCSDIARTNSIAGTIKLENPRKLRAF